MASGIAGALGKNKLDPEKLKQVMSGMNPQAEKTGAVEKANEMEMPVAPQAASQTGVAKHGDEAHNSGGSNNVMNQENTKRRFGGIGGLMGGLFYKMPSAGKYNNSPMEKNYGTPTQRGFKTPLELKSFGIGSIKGGVTAKPRSKTGAGGKFNN